MTVKELIKKLLDYNPDAKIVFEDINFKHPIDYIGSNNQFTVSLKSDVSKLAR